MKKVFHRKFHLVVYFGCAISVFIVLMIGGISVHYINEQNKMDRSIARTYRVIAGINLIQYSLNEISQNRNAVDDWLPDMDSGIENTKSGLLNQFSALKNVLSDDHVQQKRVTILNDRIDELFAIWKSDKTTPVSSKVNVYRQRIMEDKKMEEVRKVINDINYAEQQLLVRRRGENMQLSGQIKWVTTSAVIVVLAIVISLVTLIINELKYRRHALEREQEASKLKSNFVSLASHEFRTPLSSVLLSVNLIRRYSERGDSQNIVKHCNRIEAAVKNLITILEDFLSLEKLETGKVQASYRQFDLKALCEEIVDDMRTIAGPHQYLCYEYSGSDELVLLDEHLIRNSIINLVSNAIKYAGEDARIFVRTDINQEKITITVGDNGIGISEKDQKRLFKPFFRVNEDGNIPGTGLGLNIVMRYVKLMKGSLTVSSIPGKETLFAIAFQQPDKNRS